MKIRDVNPEEELIVPKCPHCMKKLDEVLRITDKGKKWYVGVIGVCYICPHCEVVLGFSSPFGA